MTAVVHGGGELLGPPGGERQRRAGRLWPPDHRRRARQPRLPAQGKEAGGGAHKLPLARSFAYFLVYKLARDRPISSCLRVPLTAADRYTASSQPVVSLFQSDER